jgi:hypothetical protein
MAGPESQNSPRKIKAADKQVEALNLRRAGEDYEEIAQKVGYRAASGAWHAVRAALQRNIREPADEVRKLEVDRLDRLLGGIWEKAVAGDGEAIDRVLRIMKRRAELLGLDAPKNLKMEHSGEVVLLDWDSLVRAVPAEELRDRIADQLERSILDPKEAERNGSNGHA